MRNTINCFDRSDRKLALPRESGSIEPHDPPAGQRHGAGAEVVEGRLQSQTRAGLTNTMLVPRPARWGVSMCALDPVAFVEEVCRDDS
jgi:hypothetical protein